MHVDGSKWLWGGLAALVSWCSFSPVILAGEATWESPNFTVVAESRSLARELGSLAETYRREIALEWLQRVLPTAPQRTTIRVRLAEGPSRATTLVDPAGTAHHVSIAGSTVVVAQPLLRHEVAHTVLLTALGKAIPDWANEGIASRYDNATRHAIRQQKLRDFATFESWPGLERLFASPIEAQWSYAASVSVTDYLVQRRGKREFIAFLLTADAEGYDVALSRHYSIGSLAQLELAWRNHVRLGMAQTSQDEPRGGLVLVR